MKIITVILLYFPLFNTINIFMIGTFPSGNILKIRNEFQNLRSKDCINSVQSYLNKNNVKCQLLFKHERIDLILF